MCGIAKFYPAYEFVDQNLAKTKLQRSSNACINIPWLPKNISLSFLTYLPPLSASWSPVSDVLFENRNNREKKSRWKFFRVFRRIHTVRTPYFFHWCLPLKGWMSFIWHVFIFERSSFTLGLKLIYQLLISPNWLLLLLLNTIFTNEQCPGWTFFICLRWTDWITEIF